jgi:DNA polymerase III alpha subunit (gram-positive type)
MNNQTEFLNQYLKDSIASYKETPRTRFFKEDDLNKLENSNVLKFSDINLVESENQLEDIKLGCVFGIDIETTGFNPVNDYIVGIGLSDGSNHYYINLPEDSTEDYYECVRLRLTELLDNCVTVLAHNAKFEYKFLKVQLAVTLPLEKTKDIPE